MGKPMYLPDDIVAYLDKASGGRSRAATLRHLLGLPPVVMNSAKPTRWKSIYRLQPGNLIIVPWEIDPKSGFPYSSQQVNSVLARVRKKGWVLHTRASTEGMEVYREA